MTTLTNAQLAAEIAALTTGHRYRLPTLQTIWTDMLAREGQANGIATLGAGGTVPAAQLDIASLIDSGLFYNISQHGVVGDGVNTGDAATLNALIVASGDVSVLSAPERTKILLTNTLLFQDKHSVHLNSWPRNIFGYAGGSRLIWGGAAGGTVVTFNYSTGCGLKGFFIEGGNADRGVVIDGYTSGHISSSNTLEDLLILPTGSNANWVGVQIAGTTLNNNEFMTFRNCRFYGGNTGKGVVNEDSSNAHAHVFHQCDFQNSAIGLHCKQAGFRTEGNCSFNNNDIDIKIDAQSYPVDITFTGTENSRQFIYINGNTSPVRIANCRIVGSQAPVGKGMFEFGSAAGFVVIENCNIGSPPAGAYTFDFTNAGSNLHLTLRNNRYGDSGLPDLASLCLNLNLAQVRLVVENDDFFLRSPMNYWSSNSSINALLEQEAGAALSISGNAITLTRNIHSVGAGLLKTISPPGTFMSKGGIVYLITGATPFTTDATGNIGRAITPAANTAVAFVYDGSSKWWPT